MMTGEEWLAQHRAQRLQGMTEKERTHYQMAWRIARECGEATEAFRRGDGHPRHYNPIESRMKLETRRKAYLASFMPVRPEIIVTKKPENPYWMDYQDRRHGPGGAEYME